MATCPLCRERASRRYCPAKEEQICAICCGTLREIEIDCPGDCPHLRAGRSYEAEKRAPDPELAVRVRELDRDKFQQLTPVIEGATRVIVEEHLRSPWLVDNDIIDVYNCLRATLKTLSSGIYYESLPESPARMGLYTRLKTYFDQLMQPQAGPQGRALRLSEMLEVIDFLMLSGELHAGTRPKSRRYLDWLTSLSASPSPTGPASGLIVPGV
jgi:hypothetical protein